MPNTFELIASSTVGSGGASSIDFTSIPSTYTDLCLKVSLRGTRTANFEVLGIRFNGSTTGYKDRSIFGNGSSTGSYTDLLGTSIHLGNADGSSSTSNTFASQEAYIPNYAGSNYKSVSVDSVFENNATAADQFLVAGLWQNSAAINQITIITTSGTFVQYSTAYLYGVKNA